MAKHGPEATRQEFAPSKAAGTGHRDEMMIEKMLKTFASEEKGNVTVDWLVLTAGLVGLAVAILATVNSASSDLATRTDDAISFVAASQG